MGGAPSVLNDVISRHCTAEFKRLCPKGRDFLVLSELRQLQSIEDLPIDMNHLGTLFVLDADRNGRVTLQELMQFATMCAKKRKDFRQHEFPLQMKGFCTLCMFDAVTVEGEEAFVLWFTLLFSESHHVKTFADYPGVAFCSRDAAHTVHEVLQIDDNYGYDVQRFFDLCQRTGEELGVMSIEDERLDELIPREALEMFARSFIQGLLRLMTHQLHFTPLPPQPPPLPKPLPAAASTAHAPS